METTPLHRNSIEAAKYTVGVKTYKTAERVKMREVKIYGNGAWIYCDAYTEEERETHEQRAWSFLESMKLNDARQCLGQPEQMKGCEAKTKQTVQQMIWNTLLPLRDAGLMTSREAAGICLVRFTWTPEEAEARLLGLQERLVNTVI